VKNLKRPAKSDWICSTRHIPEAGILAEGVRRDGVGFERGAMLGGSLHDLKQPLFGSRAVERLSPAVLEDERGGFLLSRDQRSFEFLGNGL
jgi:hypothetical protein